VATTYATIRDKQVTVVQALTPAIKSGTPFRVFRGEGQLEFPAWVEANPNACWRRFEILNNFNITMSGLTNAGGSGTLWQFSHDATLVIAYPRQFGRYGADNERELDDVIDSDLAQIDKAIGPDGNAIGNWVDGLDSCTRQDNPPSVTKTQGAVLVACTYSLLYDRSY
jgi:hypothetical protein